MQRRQWFSRRWSVAVALTVGMLVSWSVAPFCWAASEAEQAILKEIEDFNAARLVGDVSRILSHLADDAKFTNFAGRKQTKTEYGAAVKKRVEDPSTRDIKIRYRAIKVDFPDPARAVVLLEQNEGVRGNFTQQGWDENNRLVWTFEKRGEKWLIVEQTWLKK